MEPEVAMQNDQSEKTEDLVEEKPSKGYSEGRTEPANPEAPGSVDEVSAYDLSIAGEPVREVQEEDSLPPVPEGVVPSVQEAPVFDAELSPGELRLNFEETRGDDGQVEVIRFVGSSIGPEFDGFAEDYVSPEQGTATFEEVLVQLLDAALEGPSDASEPLTGEGLVKIFCRGDVQDERVVLLLSLLAQDQPVTGELVVAVLRAQGHEYLVDGALLAREELARAGDVAVEQLEASSGHFVPLGEGQPGKPGQPGGSGSGSGPSQSPNHPTTQLAPSLAPERPTLTRETTSTAVEAL